MKKIYLPLICAIVLVPVLMRAQDGIIRERFTALDGDRFEAFDSLRITDLTRGGDTVLIYPDTVLLLGYTAVPWHEDPGSSVQLWQNYPNPMAGQTEVKLVLGSEGKTELSITDPRGSVLKRHVVTLTAGVHTFRVTCSGTSWYLLTATKDGKSSSVKLVNTGEGSSRNFEITYLRKEKNREGLKETSARAFVFKPGDTLLCICYSGGLQSARYTRPAGEDTVAFQFAFAVPCPGMPEVIYEGVTYHTVQVFSQCWMKENLNAGVMIPGNENASDNGIIEKYCYDNNEDSCASLGAFYQWGEMMAYASVPGSRGICPPGWHVPTDADWKIIEGEADSLYKVGDAAWDSSGVRGVTAGFTMKSPWYWANDGNGSDLLGMTILPSGYRDSWGNIFGFEHAATFWCADQAGDLFAWTRGLGCHGREVSRFDMEKAGGYSVRCLRD